MKAGIIRCMQTEDMCCGYTDFVFIKNKKGAFQDVDGEIQIIGFMSCGGCPGKKVVTRVEHMINRGADTIVFASCISRGNPIGFSCPHYNKYKSIIENKYGDKVRIIDSTH